MGFDLEEDTVVLVEQDVGVEQTRGWSHGPALHDQRRDHQDENADKQPLVAMRIGQAGDDAEVYRNRPAQPHPGGEGYLTQVKRNGSRQKNTATGEPAG